VLACWSDVVSSLPLLHYFLTPLLRVPPAYPLLGLCGGYALVMLFAPVRTSLRDGFRCIVRFPRICITFVVFGFAYLAFHFATFSPIHSAADLDLAEVVSLPTWTWPRLAEVWRQIPLPILENVAGIFDNATTTYPLSVLAALLIIGNWRGLHGALFEALRKRFRLGGILIYLILLLSAFAAIVKPITYWALPVWGGFEPSGRFIAISSAIDAIAFIFEYLFGVYIQVYLITVCFAWIRGLGFEQGQLFRFAVRRFAFVLKWAGTVVVLWMLMVKIPLAYVTTISDVPERFDYQRLAMCVFIILFASVQVSLVLHNEGLRDAFRAHGRFMRRNWHQFGWFLLVAALHFFFIMAADAIMRGAIGQRVVPLVVWNCFFITARGFITGWLLASWVCLFRRQETAAVGQEHWIQY